MFLRQENHSIIPFLLISNKEVHRMCLSDYEIKLIYKTFQKKSKLQKMDGFDFYKIGLVNFYKGKFQTAYTNFKVANKLRSTEPNISKWFAFTCIVLLFCDKKIDFTNLLKVDLEPVDKSETSDNLFSMCCGVRKSTSEKVNKKNVYQILKNEPSDSSRTSPIGVLANEAQEQLKLVLESEKHALEGWWLQMLISIYCNNASNQTLFKSSLLYDAKYCAMKIKHYDKYLFYIAYAELSYILTQDYKIDEVLSDLIFNPQYKNRIEAYLRYWQLLVKGRFMDYRKANTLSELYVKCSSHNFDDNKY